jgi:hypothetical protein
VIFDAGRHSNVPISERRKPYFMASLSAQTGTPLLSEALQVLDKWNVPRIT